MNSNQTKFVHKKFLEHFDLDQQLAKPGTVSVIAQQLSLPEFITQLKAQGHNLGLIYMNSYASRAQLADLLSNEIPILVFSQSDTDDIQPLILKKEEKAVVLYKEDGSAEKFENSKLLPQFLTNEEGKIIALVAVSSKELASDIQSPSKNAFNSFIRLISSEKKAIWYIFVYAIFTGLISLSLPLGIQSIINFINSGIIATSVIILIIFVIVGLLFAGAMQVMQLYIVEHIQQRLFVKTAFNIADRIPKVKMESILKFYTPELVNRFFDILNVQKGISNILIDMSSALIQIFFGLGLLSFYHPYFIFFGILLVAALGIIGYFSGSKGLKTSLLESKYKYKLAFWLEEVARTLITFKMSSNTGLVAEKTDHIVADYIKSRKKHFKILILQYFSFVGFKTIITAALLILGSVLVVNNEINIGQFVASEIIIILIMNAVEKVISKIDKIYDLLTSSIKLEQVTTLPLEHLQGLNVDSDKEAEGLSIRTKNLKYKYPESAKYTLQGINLEIGPGERVCISGSNNSGKNTLVHVMLGILEDYEGAIFYDGLSLKDINKNSLYQSIANTFYEDEIFHASIMENITLGKLGIRKEDLLWALDFVGLTDYIGSTKYGLDTEIIGGSLRLPENIARKILLARSIVTRPRLLVLDGRMLGNSKQERNKLLDRILDKENTWTVVIKSNDLEVMKRCEKNIFLQNGYTVYQGSYKSVKKEKEVQELIG